MNAPTLRNKNMHPKLMLIAVPAMGTPSALFATTLFATTLFATTLFATTLFATTASSTAKAPASSAARFDQLDRATFNQRVVEHFLPLFWRADADGDGALDADELVVLHHPAARPRADYVDDKGGFTPKMVKTYQALVAQQPVGGAAALLQKELAQGAPTLVESDFRPAPASEQAFVRLMVDASKQIENIYAQQRGVAGLQKGIADSDTRAQAVFWRNQGPLCEAPQTEHDPSCNALGKAGKPANGLYPAGIQSNGFCSALEKRQDAQQLLHPFVVVRAKPGDQPTDPATAELVAVPYNVAFKQQSEQISHTLKNAAKLLDTSEAPLKTYLEAAAASFLSNDWQPADEAWSKMNAQNSKWYLRIGPDEVGEDPCARKAGYHMSFARINAGSLEWQSKLAPRQQEMEQAMASLAGKPYVAHTVTFHLPDFIDIVLNAGDSRAAHGGTIGQSLPNWGPVANEGRGRTVAMTNLYTDADSGEVWRQQASSLFCPVTMKKASFDAAAALMSTVLHEAGHNLGPSHEYQVNGKTDDQIFGGPLAATLEELKAQTEALWFSDWLVDKGVIKKELAEVAHLRDITWAFGHIAQGMYTATERPKPYSQLAAIQLGLLHQQGVLNWQADTMAANGKDKGCFEVDLNKWKLVVDAMGKRVLSIKGAGNKADAEKLKADFVDAKDQWGARKDTIRERWLRAPKASFVYAIHFD
jgi:hypothetical protein